MLNTYRAMAMDELKFAAASERMAHYAYFTDESRANMRAKAQRHRCKASDYLKRAATYHSAPYAHIEE